jgi:DNA-binding LacI/PurR family transcriptional regulator
VLGRRNRPTIAYVTNWNTRWGWREVTAHPDFFAGADSRARELGFELEHFWMREPGLTHGRLSRILEARGIQGVIIASHVREIDDELHFDWTHFSAVKIDYFPHEPQLHLVTNDQLQIARLATQQVIERGYRRVAFVMDEGWDITVERLWSAGFLWEQQTLDPEDRIPPFMIPRHGDVADWLEQQRPDVIVSKAEFVMPALGKLGWRVPRDVGFVDLFLQERNGKQAGVWQNHAEVGGLAVEILAGQLQQNKHGIPDIPTRTLVEGTWVDGASIRSARAAASHQPSAVSAK